MSESKREAFIKTEFSLEFSAKEQDEIQFVSKSGDKFSWILIFKGMVIFSLPLSAITFKS